MRDSPAAIRRILAAAGRAAADDAAAAAAPPSQDYRTPRENDDALCAGTVEGGEWPSSTGFISLSLIEEQFHQM